MLFNSFVFALFLPLVFILHCLARSRRGQNAVLLCSSYVFYGWWDARFLVLIVASSVIDYKIGERIARAERPGSRNRLLAASLVANLGMLGTFKYYDFFATSLQTSFAHVGIEISPMTLNVILPVGISFYTFQTLSYTLDIHKGRLAPHRSLFDFMTFVAFFPQLVAGPIERARNLLGQFEKRRAFDIEMAKDGLRQMLWGFVKKLLVADQLAVFVDSAYADAPDADGARLMMATVFFAFQIYADFSGYSDIAIGCAKLFGIRLMQNFSYPYFSTTIAEFWKRWHISLSSWFGDYVYIGLGGNRFGKNIQLRNILIVFILSGLWHGANWTFVAWGLVHAVMYIPVIFFGIERNAGRIPGGDTLLPSFANLMRMVGTFSIVTFAWVFFRADSLGHVGEVFVGILTRFSMAGLAAIPAELVGVVCVFVLLEWLGRHKIHPLDIPNWPRPWRRATYGLAVLALLLFGPFSKAPFIYFQF